MEEKIDIKKLVDQVKEEFERIFQFFKDEVLKIRTSRPNPALIENLTVEIFGQKFFLKQLGAISIPRPREMVIKPWDNSYIEGIVKAIENSPLGLSLSVKENEIVITFPPLTEEFKKNISKLIVELKEKARKKMREERERVWNKIQRGTREGIVSEEEKYRAKKLLQEIIEDYNQKLEEILEEKLKEIEG